ncbi:MAG: DNA-directed RNA polymerase I subunit [Monoraphidium minutum]|nr:MAG: DNA-directed RNA polymerase I subunit [Monoraphidium minutum]
MASEQASTSASKDWMFCPISGYLLELDPVRGVAHCPMTGYQKSLGELSSIKIESQTNMAEYRRQFNLEPLVKDEVEARETGRVRATVDEKCPQCGHEGMEFYTMQLRSADEGQTVFYECPDCRYKYSTNT